MEIIPVTGALGAELRGVDVRNLDDDFDEVKAALLEHRRVIRRCEIDGTRPYFEPAA